MALSVPFSSSGDSLVSIFQPNLLPATFRRKIRYGPITCSYCASNKIKIVRDRRLDRHVVRQNQIRFVQKLKTLLLSKPKHYIPLHILSKCRSYLALEKPHSILSMIHRYPTIFELFSIPLPPTPLNATTSGFQLCVRLTPAASSLAAKESHLKSDMSLHLASKLQKLLMLSSHHRLLLPKLVHLGPDLGLPPNFRSRLCNDHPHRFKTVETSYGRALELVSWDHQLAQPLILPKDDSLNLIVDRPPKFNRVRLRRGLNLKRPHEAFLIKFNELPDICPYTVPAEKLARESMEAEKRACAVVRQVLGMTVEKRTLIDHLTHFRKDFGLPNKLRSMIIRHPELFYVSMKGQRDSVFLVEGYNSNGELLDRDRSLVIKDELMELVREGKRLRREKRKRLLNSCTDGELSRTYSAEDEDGALNCEGDYDDGFENLFDSVDSYEENYDDVDYGESDENLEEGLKGEFWSAECGSFAAEGTDDRIEPW